jgi:hypothetical protein
MAGSEMTETPDMFSNYGGTLVANRVVPSVEPTRAIAACSSEFQGKTYSPSKDKVRLCGQLRRVREAMADHTWRTLSEISEITGDPEASVSARLRDLKKARFGFYVVKSRRRSAGQWEYKIGNRGL